MAKLLSVSPQYPLDVVVEFDEADEAAVEMVMARARTAQAVWSEMPVLARSAALVEIADAISMAATEITDLGVREVGKARGEMAGEIARGISILRYYAQSMLDPDGEMLPVSNKNGLLFTRRRPYGVVGVVTPWNFPVAIPLWKAAPALAYGNAVVCKPSPFATAIALRLEEIFSLFLPPGCFSVVPGGLLTGQAVVNAVDGLSFTGSATAGQAVVLAAAVRKIPVQAEMGGQNPSIVLPDAPFEQVAEIIAHAAMDYAGQKCTATSRVIVLGDPRPFTDALVAAVKTLVVGDPADPHVVVRPVISHKAQQMVTDAIDEARAGGGQILVGGTSIQGHGYFVDPTLIAGLDPRHRLAQEEVFGPFATVLTARDADEAIRIANDVRYGLVGSVFTGDLDRALSFVDRLNVGMVRVNAPTTGVDFYAPFGGVKDSSIGPREQGKAARDFYTWTQTVTISPARESV